MTHADRESLSAHECGSAEERRTSAGFIRYPMMKCCRVQKTWTSWTQQSSANSDE